MGQKIPAKANRLGVWVKREKDPEPRLAAEYDSVWYADFSDLSSTLEKDWLIRESISRKFGRKAGISNVKIKRKDKNVVIDIHSVRPANILGKDNQRINDLKTDLHNEIGENVKFNVIEADFNHPQIIAEKIAYDMERRIAFRRAAKTALSKAMASPDVLGIKVIISGRLGGAEIARTEWYLEGKVPLHTWSANINNAFAEAETTYGIIGVKVIINSRIKKPSSNNSSQSGGPKGGANKGASAA
ncbi:MAG TPA: 30S ribosomal protein S3 [Vampirovibrionales bacterium]